MEQNQMPRGEMTGIGVRITLPGQGNDGSEERNAFGASAEAVGVLAERRESRAGKQGKETG